MLAGVFSYGLAHKNPKGSVYMANDNTTNKTELRKKAEALIKDYNDAVQSGNYEASVKLNEEIEKTINEYTSIVRTECFDALKETDDPMLEAVKQLTYPTIRAKDTKAGEEKIPVRTLEDIDRPIDLLKLHKHVGGDGIGVDKNWAYIAEKFNFLLTAQKAVDLGIDPKTINDSYAMSKISRQFDMGRTPTSKTNILKTLQGVITAMLGEEYKATSHDVNFLMAVYSRKNRNALTVTCANHRYLRQYLAEICHRIVTNGSYELDYRRIQK